MELSKEEIDERISVLKRFRELLEKQREKFAQYLKVLELQEAKITSEDTDSLLAHTELESEIVSGIMNLQKVIVPMESLYNSFRTQYNPKEAIPVSVIQNDLEALQKKVLKQNEKNRELLKVHMTTLRQQIQNFKNPYRNSRSIYASKAAMSAGSRIAIEI